MNDKRKYYYKKKYPDGIGHNFWQKFVSPTMIRLRGNKCEKCKSEKNLETCHTDYIELINKDTLKVLCRRCHKEMDKRSLINT